MGNGQNDIRAMALLERALKLPADDRAEWIATQTDETEGVIRNALEMLETLDPAAERISTGAPGETIDDTPPPERIGAYRVVELLGRGGMGAVYKAERDAGDFEHLVAIKLIRPGLLSEELIARFARERQILADLNHPGIARLYDGGTTEDSSPYIVMEYIDGQSIDRWVIESSLDTDAILALMINVCDSVSFAHQNLVVHRDLTPSNVLVTPDGTPRIIDFGIAKPQGAEGLTGVNGNSLSRLSLTPGYAAPERYSGAAATTLSDIYSLGKLLEKLLSQAHVDKDLQAIIDRAAAEQPADRYATANALKQDLGLYRAGFPITARDVTSKERAVKFYRRNRIIVIAGAAGIVALLGALLLATTAYFRAESARAAEATRVAQLRELANYMLFDHNEELSRVVGNGEARGALVEKAQTYLLTLSDLAKTDPSLLLDTARGFVELARIQGVAAQPNLGQHDLADENLNRAETLLKSIGQPTDPDISASLARLYSFRALILMHTRSKPKDAQAAITQGEKALAMVPEVDRNSAWYEARSDIRRAQLETADLDLDSKEMGNLVHKLRSEIDEWPEELRQSQRAEIEEALAQYYYATHFSFGENLNPVRSLREYAKADDLFKKYLEQRPNEPYALYFRAWNGYYAHGVAAQNDRYSAALQMLDNAELSIMQLRRIEEKDESLERFDELLTEARADLLARMGQFSEALELQQAIVSKRAKIAAGTESSSNISDLAYGHVVLADIARRAGEKVMACASYSQAEDKMSIIDKRGDLRGYVANLRPGVLANRNRCNKGRPLSEFTQTGEE